jgi:4-hydroxybutyrate CoA-transferase
MNWQREYKEKLTSIEKAASVIKSGDTIAFSGASSCPADILNAIGERYEELKNVTTITGMLMRPLSYLKPECRGHINHHTIFVGPLERLLMHSKNIGVTSVHFSEINHLFTDVWKSSVCIFECSPPDERGYLSYGPVGTFCNDLVRKYAHTIIVQVNKNTPFVNGTQAHIHVSEIDYIVENDQPLPEMPQSELGETEQKIAAHIVKEIPDGAVIQLGVGKLANAVGHLLVDKKDLGIHTEMLTDSMVELIESGVINGKKKNFCPQKAICSFAIGNRKMYDMLHNNPFIETHPISWVNDPFIIARNDNFMSVNNALAVDLTGQVASESLGYDVYSGTGGQVDFIRGARMSRGGKSFIGLKSTTRDKEGNLISRITTTLKPGTAVTTPRSDVDYIVTENGIVNLRSKSIQERVKAMISIAHPDFREPLEQEAVDAGLLPAD